MPPSSLPGTQTDFLLEEQIRYSYDRPIRHLRHRLIVIPRDVHGDQIRRDFAVSVSDKRAGVTITEDAFSNSVVLVNACSIDAEIVFSIWATVTTREKPVTFEPAALVNDVRFLHSTPLTHATDEIAEVGRELVATGNGPNAIAEMASSWAHQSISYGYGVTNVYSPAGEALAGGSGVCQDYAHIMLAVCRAAGVSARYVSGHLTGEGGSHAWVEVLQRAPSGPGMIATGFDPTHDRFVDSRYLTVAVGRDYADVAPTSGTFRGRAQGQLDVQKLVTEVESDDPKELRLITSEPSRISLIATMGARSGM